MYVYNTHHTYQISLPGMDTRIPRPNKAPDGPPSWGPLRVFSMYTGWGTAEMVTHAVGRELQRLGIDMESLGPREDGRKSRCSTCWKGKGHQYWRETLYFGMFCSIKHGGRGSYKTVLQHMANSVIAGIAAHVVSKSGLILDKVQTDAMMHHDAWG